MLNQNKIHLLSVKTLTLISFLTIFLCNSLFAQGWFPLNSGITATCNGVFFIDANTGYINLTNDGNGQYLKTTNAGTNWSVQTTLPVPATDWQRSVFFTDVNTGYIISADPNNLDTGNVYKTINGGANWTSLTLPVYRHFCSIFFINSNTGYVSGWQVILKTTNAGSTWVSQSFPSGVELLWSIYFVDANTGYAAGGNTGRYIIKTTNGGNNWQTVYSHVDGLFFGISFIDANTGAAVGGKYSSPGSYVNRTTNGGINWTETFTDSSNIGYLWSVRFVSPSIGYAAGGNPGSNGLGVILKTTNAGLNWYQQTTNANYGLLGNYFTSENTGYVVGWGGHILKTTDGGGPIGIEPISNEVPAQFNLYQNYPNPFNPNTKIKFQIVKVGQTFLSVYDVLGREIATLLNEQLNAGTYEVDWDARNYPSGVYYYQLTVNSEQLSEYKETKKMVLMK
jgi:photosystem II stability/assembly factor-like uncharacterized protein